MSCASNLGYGGIYPNSNVNSAMVNVDGSTYAGQFGSNEIPSSSHSMRGASNNVAATSGNWTDWSPNWRGRTSSSADERP